MSISFLHYTIIYKSIQFLNGKQISTDQVRLSLNDRVPQLRLWYIQPHKLRSGFRIILGESDGG